MLAQELQGARQTVQRGVEQDRLARYSVGSWKTTTVMYGHQNRDSYDTNVRISYPRIPVVPIPLITESWKRM